MNLLAKTKLNIPMYLVRGEVKFIGELSVADKNFIYEIYDYLQLKGKYVVEVVDWLDDNTSGLFDATINTVFISNRNTSNNTVIAHEFRHAYQRENHMMSYLSEEVFGEESVQAYWLDYLEIDAFNFELWYCFEKEVSSLPVITTDYGIETMASNKEEVEELLWKRYDIVLPRLKQHYR